ncbi:MAG TPA: lipoyl synthase [Dehalococcoidia bacterium]|nr:lipoyl synthase [Dehalococcoidia bacterium]
MSSYARRPEWLKLKPLDSTILTKMRKLTRGLKLHTICESARCPNRTECFAQGTATFMILGDICTRNCTFCAVKHGKPEAPDPEEPEHILSAVKKLGLRYVVITSVTRDDLPDGGASQFAQIIKALRAYDSNILVEVLVPDFRGSLPAWQIVIDASPDVLNHNVETVPRLYLEVRPGANYQRSLELLRRAKLNGLLTKSGLMLGLGERENEVIEVMEDLREAGCDSITLGQYLRPSLKHHEVVRYVTPAEFAQYEVIARKMGFLGVASGPLVRSSFNAIDFYNEVRLCKNTNHSI